MDLTSFGFVERKGKTHFENVYTEAFGAKIVDNGWSRPLLLTLQFDLGKIDFRYQTLLMT